MNDFLNVSASLTGKHWTGPDADQDRMAQAMAQTSGLPAPLCQILTRLGVSPAEAKRYLNPRLRDLLPDPHRLRDMKTATARFLAAWRRKERIAIFADYDVDGGASAALLICWLREMGHMATLYVPDRISEGYGPNETAMATLARNHDLIVCVDCGTLSHGPLAAAKGRDAIVLDHHLGGEILPPALAVVNPNRQDEDGTLGHLCAAGVVFLMLVEARRQMREAGEEGPDLMAMLDLVALATVADVVPLIGVNRALVRQGLKTLTARVRPGLRALVDVARISATPNVHHLGFMLGPRVNAGGRIGKADLGARLLSTADDHEAAALAERLDKLNTERREIENRVRDAALAQAEAHGTDAPLVWAAGEGWHPGVAGIVASRLKEATDRPAVVIGLDGDMGKGSGRSVTGVDLGSSVRRLVDEGLLIAGGGHRMAAGLTVSRGQLDTAMVRLAELLARQGAGNARPDGLRLDSLLTPNAATLELVTQIAAAGPFGASAPAPRFAFADQRICFAKRVGENHLRLEFSAATGPRIGAIAFGAFDTALGPALLGHGGALFHFAGQLELDEWGGRRRVRLRLEDAAPAG